MARTWTTKNGIKVRSPYECDVIDDLLEREIEFEYEPCAISYNEPVTNGACRACGSGEVIQRRSYTPDIYLPSSDTWVECKGYFRQQNRKLMRAFIDGNPQLDLRFMFSADGWLAPKSKAKNKRRYSDWARARGVVCHVGRAVPEDWL